MTQLRGWMLVAVLSLALVGAEGQAATKKKHKAEPDKSAAPAMVWKTYSLADMIDPAAAPEETDLFVKFVKKAVEPSSWKTHGGHGTVHYQAACKSLVVHQTPAVQAKVKCLLSAMAMLKSGAEKHAQRRALDEAPNPYGGYFEGPMPASYPPPPPPVALSCPAVKAPSGAKQYGHFVMEDVKVNAMGVTTTIKKIRFMYKGDGIEADVAKCALTNGDSERKGDLDKLIGEVSKLVEKKEGKKEKTEEAKPCCPSCPVPCQPLSGPVSCPSSYSCTPTTCGTLPPPVPATPCAPGNPCPYCPSTCTAPAPVPAPKSKVEEKKPAEETEESLFDD